MNQKEVEQFARDHLSDYFPYLAIPSISAQNKGIKETTSYLAQVFKDLGAYTVEIWDDQGGNPVVFAEFKGKADKTVLFYNHYDVQPPEPLEEWHTEPFTPSLVDGNLYGRGVKDDKGELIARLVMLQYFNENGGLPLHMKFFVEGEEEIGSPHVHDYVAAHQEALKADACIWECGGKNSADHYEVVAGLKGILSFDLAVQTADADMHSSLASIADNAAWRLVEALHSMRSPDGKILVEGFYDDIQTLSQAEEAAVAAMDFDETAIQATYGLRKPLPHNAPYELINGVTMTINGLVSGYQGDGIKTVLPKYAKAKLDCRLAPGQDPRQVFAKIEAHLATKGFPDVTVTYNIGEEGYRSSLADHFTQLALQVAKEVYGEEDTRFVPNMAGSEPAQPFGHLLNVPIVLVGVGYDKSGPHAPNEHIRVSDFATGTYYQAKLLATYATL